ncbi:MAG: F0F1 ATP synthase subunit A [Coriobacteriia bacterium]|nr:F0F1 ATP synthase subunit A [Coriobacteriia bacterium]
MPYIALFNFTLVGVVLVVLGTLAGRRMMTEVPESVQNLAEFTTDWFVKQARGMGSDVVMLAAPFLATIFALILGCNLLMLVPLPIIHIPPTAFYSVPLAMALTAIFGIVVLNGIHRGILPAVTHLVWPNPIQLVSEVSDVLSLSLRLFGNIGGEYMVVLLVTQAAPIGIPVIIHGLGLIPSFIQPLVFTLLTANFLATAIHHESKEGEPAESERAPAASAAAASGAA